jgi:hypothetical protein
MSQISLVDFDLLFFQIDLGAYLNERFWKHNQSFVEYVAKSLIEAFLIFSLISLAGNATMEPDNPKMVPANEIISQIETGEDVNYNEVLINDDININKINLPVKGLIKSSIRITNSKILGCFDFSGAKIKNILDFDGTYILGDSNFEKTEFYADVTFQATSFNKSSIFRKAKFNKSADFLAANFKGNADFSQALFLGKDANFKRSKFKENTSFFMAEFDTSTIDFESSEFDKPITFLSAKFSGKVNFAMSRFKELADFRFAEFENDADFSGTRFDKKIDLTGLRFTSIRLSWDSIKDKLICSGPTYISLIKNFKEMEQFEDADNCYVRYRDWKRETRKWGWPLLADYLAWLSCGYGIKWQNAVLSAISIIMLFGIYFESNHIVNVIYNFTMKRKTDSFRMEEFKQSLKMSIWLSAMILLSLPAEWYPYGKAEYTRLVKVHLISSIFERLIGWSLMLLLIGTLTRLMVRY